MCSRVTRAYQLDPFFLNTVLRIVGDLITRFNDFHFKNLADGPEKPHQIYAVGKSEIHPNFNPKIHIIKK